jgi:hypothetical protein
VRSSTLIFIKYATMTSKSNMHGVADHLTLPQRTVLYHGTLADKFVHQDSIGGPAPSHYIHPPTPDGPAWFAENIAFSLHAAIRFTNPNTRAQISLYEYTVRYPISMMSFENMDSFAEYLYEQHGITADTNDVMEAAAVAQRGMDTRLDGFALDEDIVRGERELVLWETGMARLGAPVIHPVTVMPVDETTSILVDEDGEHLGTYYYDEGVGELHWGA